LGPCIKAMRNSFFGGANGCAVKHNEDTSIQRIQLHRILSEDFTDIEFFWMVLGVVDEKKRSKPARRCKDQARQAGKNQEENKLLTRSWHF
jgi:hypothetical protein